MPIMGTPRAKEFVKLLRERVAGKTASHCIFTAEFMSSFADQAGVTNDQAVTAGLLHDLCKGLDKAEYLACAEDYGIPVGEAQRLNPKLLHGPIAAEECRRDLGVDDEAVYEAIYWHTTGRPELGPVGRALFLADFAEPTRLFAEAVETRALLRREGFESALLYAARQKVEHVREKRHVDPMTEAFCEWLECGCG